MFGTRRKGILHLTPHIQPLNYHHHARSQTNHEMASAFENDDAKQEWLYHIAIILLPSFDSDAHVCGDTKTGKLICHK